MVSVSMGQDLGPAAISEARANASVSIYSRMFVTRGRVKATNRTFEDHFVFAITVRNGKLANVREYVDTHALARASEMAAGPRS